MRNANKIRKEIEQIVRQRQELADKLEVLHFQLSNAVEFKAPQWTSTIEYQEITETEINENLTCAQLKVMGE